MNILGTSYTLQYKSFDIYVAGCSGDFHCVGCHNPESWSFDIGEQYNKTYFEKCKYKINQFDSLIDNVMIFGGEPLDQDLNELKLLLQDFKSLNKIIWLFTRYEINDVPTQIKHSCDYIKTGKYIPELITEKNIMYGIKLATKNQKIYRLEEVD